MTDSIDEICTINGFEHPVEIGVGGEGVVYKVFFPSEQKIFAIKINKSSHTTEGARAFRREASLQRRVSRTNSRIPYVHDFNSPESNPFLRYIIMDYVGDAILHMTVLPVDAVVDVALSLVEALGACHERKVVHGDVKPSNVCLDGSRVSLIDFGAARHYTHLEAEYTADSEQSFFHGTIGYAAPERVFSFVAPEAFESSDIFSTGVTLYELLSGKNPFYDGGNRAVCSAFRDIFPYLLRIREKEYVPLQEHVPAIPEKLAALVHSMIEYDPKQRPLSFRTIAEELATYKASKSEYSFK